MLLAEQYKEMLKYRDTPVPMPQEDTRTVNRLLAEGFIQRMTAHEIKLKDGIRVERVVPLLQITAKGKRALEEYEAQQEQSGENRVWQMVGLTIALLSLVVTIIFGILGLLY